MVSCKGHAVPSVHVPRLWRRCKLRLRGSVLGDSFELVITNAWAINPA